MCNGSTPWLSLHSRITQGQDENVRGTNLFEFIHFLSHLLFQNQGTHGLATIIQRGNGRRTFTRCHCQRFGENIIRYIINNHVVLGCHNVSFDTSLDHIHQILVFGLWITNENGLRFEDIRNNVQTSGSHGRPCFDKIHHSIGQSQSTRRFDRPRNKLDTCGSSLFGIHSCKVLLGDVRERSHNAFASQLLDICDFIHDGGLNA
mmetsp:Transcript_13899/g.26652  ORF Transcript_13899/g.26652 Transcript_13899/m.26652 type:complete len:204 (-) Transcript_13899:385-996(-)